MLALAFAACGAHAEPWQGPIFDAHLHYNDDAVERYSIGTLYELFSKNGVKAILANSRPNDGTRALVEASLRGLRRDLKVVPFIRVYRDRSDYGAWFANPDIYRMIVEEEKRGFYRGIGEFHIYGKDAASPIVKDIVDFAVEKGFVLHAHCDEEALEILFAHNPKASIIWAHTGFTTPLARVEELLVKYPKLWGELSYRSDVTESRNLSEGWKATFARFPGRFLLGSDTWIVERWQSYPQIMSQYRNWLGQLPPDIAARIAWKNGAVLFGIE
jgi:hypothetical protein